MKRIHALRRIWADGSADYVVVNPRYWPVPTEIFLDSKRRKK